MGNTPFGMLREALLDGSTRVQDEVEAALARAQTHADLYAMRHLRAEAAGREAREADRLISASGPRAWGERPLLGVTLTVKELTAVQGMPHGRGAGGTAPAARADSPAVRRLREAGAVVLGTTCSPLGGWCGSGLAGDRPATRNPHSPDLTAGGSSGGAAAAVATGIGLAALGTDGAGSVRIPAAFCGVTGFKPTFGRVPYVPVSEEGLSHLGVLTHDAADAAAVVRAMAGPHPDDPAGREVPPWTEPAAPPAQLRLAWAPSLGDAAVDPEILRVCGAVVARLREAGHHVGEARPPAPDGYGALATILADAEARSFPGQTAERLHPVHAAVVAWGRTRTADDMARAARTREALTSAYDLLLARHDALITPTVPVLPFAADLPAPPAYLARGARSWLEWTPHTYTFNLTGHPAVTVPAGVTRDGLPVGIQIVTARFADTLAAHVAGRVQRLLPPVPPGLGSTRPFTVGAGIDH
ncbi:amidase family protein [Streptomyces sp. NPDC091265]|uniref:amidase family protein n=1 Tax=unclassified Streptomyces TaxID=2593676 RepID=UPI0034504781